MGWGSPARGWVGRVLTSQVNVVTLGGLGNAHTFTLPGGSLALDADYLDWDIHGNTVGAVNFTIAFAFGGTTLMTFPIAAVQSWHLSGRIFRTGAAAQESRFDRFNAAAVATARSTAAEVLANPLLVRSFISAYPGGGTCEFRSMTLTLWSQQQ